VVARKPQGADLPSGAGGQGPGAGMGPDTPCSPVWDFVFFCPWARNLSEQRAFDGVCVEAQKVRGPTREGVCRSVSRFLATSRPLGGARALGP
jgi:hypothetical protein